MWAVLRVFFREEQGVNTASVKGTTRPLSRVPVTEQWVDPPQERRGSYDECDNTVKSAVWLVCILRLIRSLHFLEAEREWLLCFCGCFFKAGFLAVAENNAGWVARFLLSLAAHIYCFVFKSCSCIKDSVCYVCKKHNEIRADWSYFKYSVWLRK